MVQPLSSIITWLPTDQEVSGPIPDPAMGFFSSEVIFISAFIFSIKQISWKFLIEWIKPLKSFVLYETLPYAVGPQVRGSASIVPVFLHVTQSNFFQKTFLHWRALVYKPPMTGEIKSNKYLVLAFNSAIIIIIIIIIIAKINILVK